MDKRIILLPFLLVIQLVTAQEVRFENGQLENGLIYPIVNLVGNPEAGKTLNNNITQIISTYESQDYCVGQFGYVQKTNFLQLDFYFNCIDLDESKKEHYFFSLSNGEICPTSEMFLSKEEKRSKALIQDRISQHIKEFSSTTASDEFIKSLSIDDCNVKLIEEGIQISIDSYENWPDNKLVISWIDLRPYLKKTFH